MSVRHLLLKGSVFEFGCISVVPSLLIIIQDLTLIVCHSVSNLRPEDTSLGLISIDFIKCG